MSYIERIYQKSPIFIQLFLLNLKGFHIKNTRYNSNFIRNLSKFNENLKGNKVVVDKKQLKYFLKTAESSIYWKQLFKKYKINLKSEDLFGEIKKLPIMPKSEIFNNWSDLKTNEVGKKHLLLTGGTTGQRLEIPATLDYINKQWAIWWRYRLSHGIGLNTWCGWFGGKSIVPPQQKRPPFWRFNYFGKQIMFSPTHLSLSTTKLYYDVLNKNKIKWLHGYPSQISLLASYITELGLKPIESIEIITTGAEALMDYQKSIIQKAFNAKIVNHYGLTEGVANISTGADMKYYVDYDFCLVEFIPIDEKKPERCKIIGTNYSNSAFPLIRYDTGDYALVEWINNVPIIKSIEGRQEDYVTLPNGNRFGPMNLLFKEFINIKEAQLYIQAPNLFVFNLVKAKNFTIKNENVIKKIIQDRLSDNSVRFELKYQSKVIRTDAGKIKAVMKNNL